VISPPESQSRVPFQWTPVEKVMSPVRVTVTPSARLLRFKDLPAGTVWAAMVIAVQLETFKAWVYEAIVQEAYRCH
jgi:hypothetical protein